MAVLNLYAGDSLPLTQLPSPVSLKPSLEIIWDQDTGRAQSGANKAKMIGSAVDEKRTYEIKYGILKSSELQTIRNTLHKGFFYFCTGDTAPSSLSDVSKYYRGSITYEIVQVGGTRYYKDLTVSVIEQ